MGNGPDKMLIACLVANDLASYRKQVVSFILPSHSEPLGVCGIELQGGVLQLQLDEHFQDRERDYGKRWLTRTRAGTLIILTDDTQVLLSKLFKCHVINMV